MKWVQLKYKVSEAELTREYYFKKLLLFEIDSNHDHSHGDKTLG
jgi:hypothetical protein